MKSDTCDPSRPDNMSVAIRRVALALVCAALFVIFGLAAPYRIYKHFKSKQDAASTVAIHEEP